MQILSGRFLGRLTCLAAVFLAAASSMSGQVMFSAVASKAVFAPGERIAIRLTLRNQGKKQVLISDLTLGTVTVTSFQRDGKNIAGRKTEINLDDELGAALIRSLKPLTTNQSITADWRSMTDPKLAGQALQTAQYVQSGLPIGTLYPANVPGVYRVSIQYHLPAVPGAPATAFSGKTNVASFQFQIK